MSEPQIMTRDERFFFNHAGYSWNSAQGESEEDGHLRCARGLAIAEEWARRVGLRYEWADDWIVGSHVKEFDCYDEEPTTCESVVAYLGRDVMASLGCIDDATDEYRRVIEAEMAAEALDLLLSDLERI